MSPSIGRIDKRQVVDSKCLRNDVINLVHSAFYKNKPICKENIPRDLKRKGTLH